MKDMHERGRFVPSRGNTRLSEQEVLLIRRLYATGRWTLKELAAEFDTHFTNISLIVRRKKWVHI